jgi:transcriptional regulator with XRE-family HTH domain
VSEDIDLDTEGGRLKWARIRAGFDSATEFAKACGVNPTTYRAYENSQNGYGKLAASFARKAHVPVEWLLEGGDLPSGDAPVRQKLPDTIDKAPDRLPTRDASFDDDAADLRVLDLSLPMGPGAEIDDYIEETSMKMDVGLLRALTRSSPERLRILKGVGDSMEPTITSGEWVIIDTTYNRLDFEDKIWAVRIRGNGAIKRLRSAPQGQVRIISDNPKLENDIADMEDIAILGRVVGSIKVH